MDFKRFLKIVELVVLYVTIGEIILRYTKECVAEIKSLKKFKENEEGYKQDYNSEVKEPIED